MEWREVKFKMGYKVYAGKTAYLLASDFDIVPSFENGKFTTQGFYWTEKELIYDSNGDSVTGEEPGKILIDPKRTSTEALSAPFRRPWRPWTAG